MEGKNMKVIAMMILMLVAFATLSVEGADRKACYDDCYKKCSSSGGSDSICSNQCTELCRHGEGFSYVNGQKPE
ncbi:hypothetical protein M5689_001671 [Euphorbia peplus]|nr:hypothetical protein M5689_001671 [Euphorbia peplus]